MDIREEISPFDYDQESIDIDVNESAQLKKQIEAEFIEREKGEHSEVLVMPENTDQVAGMKRKSCEEYSGDDCRRRLQFRGISRDVPEEVIQDYFEQFGSVTLVFHKMACQTKLLGLATFADEYAASKAMSRRPHVINDEVIDVRYAEARKEYQDKDIFQALARALQGSTSTPNLELDISWRNSLMYCYYCCVDTKDRATHEEHLKTDSHIETVTKRERLNNLRYANLRIEARCEIEKQRRYGELISFCDECNLEYVGTEEEHKKGVIHEKMLFLVHVTCPDCEMLFPTRNSFENHTISFEHLRNEYYGLVEDYRIDDSTPLPEKHDECIAVGETYIKTMFAKRCNLCDVYLKIIDVEGHLTSHTHYKNYKAYVKKKRSQEKPGNPNRSR